MTRGFLVAAMALLAPSSHAAELEGCRTGDETAVLLKALGREPWDLSRERIADLWPRPLTLLDCAPLGDECGSFRTCPCDRLSYSARVIAGACQCCDTFFFELRREDDGRYAGGVTAVALVDSAVDRASLVAKLRTYLPLMGCALPATGLPDLLECRDSQVDVSIDGEPGLSTARVHWTKKPRGGE